MGSGVPLLNEYKQEFLWKRLPQTILGGPKLKLGYSAPAYVYLNQILLWLLPCLLGGVFTLVLEVAYTDADLPFQLPLYCSLYGTCICIFVLVVQLITTIVQQKEKSEVITIKKKNILAEEDEIDFDSCCGVETIEFVTPAKHLKINILLHALLSGLMCGACLWYLLPYSLNRLFAYNYGATYALFVLGWLCVCIAQYSLTTAAPPELNIFKAMDVFETTPLTRPAYVLICVAFHCLDWAYTSSVFETPNQVLHILFACLPLIWICGILPPIDALFLFILEQAHVFLLGGSVMASNIRLLILLPLSLGVYLAVYFSPMCLASVLVGACMGYLFSTDLGGLGTQILKSCRSLSSRVSTSQLDLARSPPPPQQPRGFLWTWGCTTFLYHLLMMAVVGGEAAALNYFSQSIGTGTRDILGYVIIAMCVLEKLLRDSQNVYVFFGLIRNYLFPHSVERMQMFTRRKTRLVFLGVIRRIILNWVSPLLMVAYLSLTVTVRQADNLTPVTGSILWYNGSPDIYLSVWYIFGVVRAFRWCWQNTVHALVEMSVLAVVVVALPASANSTFLAMGAPTVLLIIGLCRDRIYQFSNKFYFFFVLLITFWTDKKQRRGSSAVVILLSFIFFPIVLGILLAASALSAPLLPFFTLPIFFIAFPRPNKFWPEDVGASANTCADTVYYKQFAPKFAMALRTAFANGSLGEPHPGNHYLVRYQDRLCWLMILERGAGFATVSLKGLELQETSCHTTEAARLDDIFQLAFEREKGFPVCSVNTHPFNTLTPVDAAKVLTYSDARNVLTGIIDAPSSVNTTLDFFVKSLVWVLLQHVNSIKMKKSASSESSKANQGVEINHNQQTPDLNRRRKMSAKQSGQIPNSMIQGDLDKTPRISPPPPPYAPTPKPAHAAVTVQPIKRQTSWSSSISSWSDDFDLDKKKTKSSSVNRGQGDAIASPPPQSKLPERDILEEADSFLDDMFGLPALDVNKPKPSRAAGGVGGGGGGMFSPPAYTGNSTHIFKPVTNLAGSPDFKCQHSCHISLPVKWRELPIEYSQLSGYMGRFPLAWYRHVLGLLDWSATGLPADKVATEVAADDALTQCYTQLIMACYSAFDTPGKGSNANFLYKSYIGDVPWNAMMDWLSEEKELYALVIKAFRYGLKLMIDQTLLGEVGSEEELVEYLQEYDRDWYIGLEKDPEWSHAVLANKPNLFSLGQNPSQGTHSSRLLSLQDTMVHVGRLNAEAVLAQWANLNLELLYLTNDDEERYSIQAHPTILRNLTVQAADPPLGYPIFSSKPLTIPTL